MSRGLGALAGGFAGLIAAFVLMLAVTGILLPAIGAGDAMSRGLMGTFVLVFGAPVLAAAGAVVGFRRARRREVRRGR